MKQNVQVAPLKAKVADSEKITINLGFVDLGQIDLRFFLEQHHGVAH